MSSSFSRPGGPRTSPAPPRVKLDVKAIKVNIVLPPDALPRDLVPADGPVPPDVYLDISLEGTKLAAPCRIAGKSYRRAMKALDELLQQQPAESVVVLLQGVLLPATPPAQGLVIKDGGLSVQAKTPRETG